MYGHVLQYMKTKTNETILLKFSETPQPFNNYDKSR